MAAYRPRLVPTRPWESTLRIFSALAAENAYFEPMRGLIAHIASRPYAPLLFSTTSMHALLVSQHEEIEWAHDMLRIERYFDGHRIHFEYFEQVFVKPAKWECEPEQLIETFEGFLRKAKWVSVGAIGSGQ